MSWADPSQKEDDERAKVPREIATWKCVCGAIKPKWLSESRCSYCERVKDA
jgi:hypothetical protein